MSQVSVDIDSSPKCFGVHWWQRSDAQVIQQFQDWGFNGIKNLQREGIRVNGNAARRKVIAMAQRQDCFFYFKGSYDANLDADAQIYSFNYSSYTGDLTDADPAVDKWAPHFAGWSGHK